MNDTTSASAPAVDSSSGPPPFVIFDVLNATALAILLLAIIPPLFSRHLRRMKTWFALMISSIIYCISFLLLVGRQSGSAPSFGLCIYQAGLIYAAPPTLAAGALTFVIELHWRLFSALTNIELNHARVTVLLIIPFMVHLVIFFLSIFNGLAQHSSVRRTPTGGMYCHINTKVPATVTGVVVGILLVTMILVEGYTISYLWRRRRSCKEIRINGANGHYPLQSFLRVVFYTLVGGLGIIMVDLLVNTLPDNNFVPLYMLPIIPLSVGILFGSQQDIIQFYLCRSGRKSWVPVPSTRDQSPVAMQANNTQVFVVQPDAAVLRSP